MSPTRGSTSNRNGQRTGNISGRMVVVLLGVPPLTGLVVFYILRQILLLAANCNALDPNCAVAVAISDDTARWVGTIAFLFAIAIDIIWLRQWKRERDRQRH